MALGEVERKRERVAPFVGAAGVGIALGCVGEVEKVGVFVVRESVGDGVGETVGVMKKVSPTPPELDVLEGLLPVDKEEVGVPERVGVAVGL